MSSGCEYFLKSQYRNCGEPITKYNSRHYCPLHYDGWLRLKSHKCMQFYRTQHDTTYYGCDHPAMKSSIFCEQHAGSGLKKRKNYEQSEEEDNKRSRTEEFETQEKSVIKEFNQKVNKEVNQEVNQEVVTRQEFNELKDTVELMRGIQNHILLKLYQNNKQDVFNVQAAIGAKVLLDKMNTQIFSMDSN